MKKVCYFNEGYSTPSVIVMDILSEGVLCGSDFTGSVSIDDVVDEGEEGDGFIQF